MSRKQLSLELLLLDTMVYRVSELLGNICVVWGEWSKPPSCVVKEIFRAVPGFGYRQRHAGQLKTNKTNKQQQQNKIYC